MRLGVLQIYCKYEARALQFILSKSIEYCCITVHNKGRSTNFLLFKDTLNIEASIEARTTNQRFKLLFIRNNINKYFF